MGALLRLLAVGRAAASVRAQARIACLRAGFGAAVALLVAVGLGFMVAAGHEWLRWHFSGPQASAIVGGGFLGVALIVAIIAHFVLRRQRRAPPAAVDPAAATLAALGPLASAVSSLSPAILAAAVAGFIYGFRGKRGD
ncbi:hypothetical protein STVA_08330 [Allostella vacuolata]|nr:hypothetical protein STVA_08330 [Stella vacuolata]